MLTNIQTVFSKTFSNKSNALRIYNIINFKNTTDIRKLLMRSKIYVIF